MTLEPDDGPRRDESEELAAFESLIANIGWRRLVELVDNELARLDHKLRAPGTEPLERDRIAHQRFGVARVGTLLDQRVRELQDRVRERATKDGL